MNWQIIIPGSWTNSLQASTCQSHLSSEAAAKVTNFASDLQINKTANFEALQRLASFFELPILQPKGTNKSVLKKNTQPLDQAAQKILEMTYSESLEVAQQIGLMLTEANKTIENSDQPNYKYEIYAPATTTPIKSLTATKHIDPTDARNNSIRLQLVDNVIQTETAANQNTPLLSSEFTHTKSANGGQRLEVVQINKDSKLRIMTGGCPTTNEPSIMISSEHRPTENEGAQKVGCAQFRRSTSGEWQRIVINQQPGINLLE